MASHTSIQLPLDVDNDEQAAVLFSPFRSKSVNPSSWTRKMSFWQDFLEKTSLEKRFITVDLNCLPQLFLRKGLAPKCLPTVMEELQRLGKVRPLEEYKKSSSNWASWGFTTLVKEPLTWGVSQLFGSPKKGSSVFVWPEVLKAVATEILFSLQSKIRQGVINPVLPYPKLKDLCSDDLSTNEHFDLVVNHLQQEKKIYLEETERHGLLVKVCGREESFVSPIRANDIQIFEITEARVKVENEQSVISNRIEELTTEARHFVKKNKKELALQTLRRKKRLNKDLLLKTSTLHNLEEILSKIQDAKANIMVVQALEAGSAVLKTINRENDVNKVDSIMDEVKEAMEDADEINGAMQSVGHCDDDELNAALEEELTALLNDDQRDKSYEVTASPSGDLLIPEFTGLSISDADFPPVPTHSPSSSKVSLSEKEETSQKKAIPLPST